MDRTFIVKHKNGCNAEWSHFQSSTPSSAAAKAFSKNCPVKGSCSRVIKIMEPKTGKEYKYRVSRVVSKKDVVLNGKTVSFKYTNTVKSVKK